MRAKFRCDSITEYGSHKEAKLFAVAGNSPENNQFAEATPAGELTIMIDKKAEANDFLEVGKEYYLDFYEAE